MKAPILALALLPGLLLAASCDSGGDDDRYSGIYEVTANTVVMDGCDGTPAAVDPSTCFACMLDAPFFKVKRQSFFGQTLHTTVGCDSATVCDDDGDDPDTINLSGGPLFDRTVDGSLVGEANAAATGGAGCSYTGVRYVLTPNDDGVVITRTEMRLRSDAPSAALMGDDCLDLTDTPPPANELECHELETLTGLSSAE